MIPYSKYSPTQFDIRGLGLPERRDWLVAPCILTRDSEALETSNFECLRRELGVQDGDTEDAEEHSFNHWACGWFNIILVKPGSKAAATAQECEAKLADYAVLDEDDYSEREYEEKCNSADFSWRAASYRDRIAECARVGASIFAARRDERPDCAFLDC